MKEMKICDKCGAEIEGKNNFCPYCGARCESGQGIERSVYHPAEAAPEPEVKANDYPMKWHNFLMVVMPLGAALTIFNGIKFMSGIQYHDSSRALDASYVYSVFPGLKACDLFYGIAMAALGVFQFVAWNRLYHYREKGPASIKVLYISYIISGVIYMIWASSVTGNGLSGASFFENIVSSVIMLIVNNIYYSKRKALFVN